MIKNVLNYYWKSKTDTMTLQPFSCPKLNLNICVTALREETEGFLCKQHQIKCKIVIEKIQPNFTNRFRL